MTEIKGRIGTPNGLRGQLGGSGGGGSDNYPDLKNKPKINGHTLEGDQTPADLEMKLSQLENDEGFVKFSIIAAAYDETSTYQVGDYAIYENTLYMCITEITTAEEWNPEKWSAVRVTEIIPTKNSELQNDSGFAVIDDTVTANDKAWSSSKITDEIINILPTGTASGAVASFNTSLVLPLVNIEVENTATKVYQRGVNLWDESWEAGDYDNQGNKRVYSTRTRCKNKIPVAPGVVYRFYMETVSGLAWQFYDENGEFISQQSRAAGSGGFDITTPNNCHFLTFGTWDAYGGIYRNDISVNYPCNGTNAYYPYNPNSNEYAINELDKIVTFEGVNNIFTDSGNVEVVYKKTINDAIAELQALILS